MPDTTQTPAAPETSMDNVLTRIMAFEEGDASKEEVISLFQFLVDTGMAWTLQGFYGRTAVALIEDGLITPPSTTTTETQEA